MSSQLKQSADLSSRVEELLARGVSCQRAGDLPSAEKAYRALLELQPTHRAARGYLAGILLATERAAESESIYRQLIADDPRQLDYRLHCATALQLRGKLCEARDTLLHARELLSTKNVDRPDARITIARRLAEIEFHLGHHAPALNELKYVLREAPRDAFAWELQGCARLALHQRSEAENSFRQALIADPERHSARYRLAELLHQAGDDRSAEQELRKIVDRQPGHFSSWMLLGSIFYSNERSQEAVQAFHQAVMLKPEQSSAWSNWGAALHLQGDFAAAIKVLDQAVALQASDRSAWINRAAVLLDSRRWDEAEQCYERILEFSPDDVGVRHNRAILRLLRGDYLNGIPEHEYRGTVIELRRSGKLRHRWDGSLLPDGQLTVLKEQGIGDEVMWSRYLPQAAARVASCVVECDPRLLRLFRRSFPQLKFISDDMPSRNMSAVDVVGETLWVESTLGSPHGEQTRQIAMASLPHVLDAGFQSDSMVVPYLAADDDLRRSWRKRLDALPVGMRVGISWFGGGTPLNRSKRSIALSWWRALLGIPDVAFINLQYGPKRVEGDALINWDEADPAGDLDQFAALIAELDLVISVDNTTVHLAGALGVPVWVFLPAVPDWRWGLIGERSYWYPSARLLRQTCWGNWSRPIESAARMLTECVQTKHVRMNSGT